MKANFGAVGEVARFVVWAFWLDWKLEQERKDWPNRGTMPDNDDQAGRTESLQHQETESELWPHQVGQLLEPLRP